MISDWPFALYEFESGYLSIQFFPQFNKPIKGLTIYTLKPEN